DGRPGRGGGEFPGGGLRRGRRRAGGGGFCARGGAGEEEAAADRHAPPRRPEVAPPLAAVGQDRVLRQPAVLGGQRRAGGRRPGADRLVPAGQVIRRTSPWVGSSYFPRDPHDLWPPQSRPAGGQPPTRRRPTPPPPHPPTP